MFGFMRVCHRVYVYSKVYGALKGLTLGFKVYTISGFR